MLNIFPDMIPFFFFKKIEVFLVENFAEEKTTEKKNVNDDSDEFSRLDADAPRRVLDINPFDQIARLSTN